MNRRHGQSGIIALASLLLLLLLVPVGCGDAPPDDPTGTLEGTVLFWEGDFFPGSPTGTKTPVVREVLVYEAATHTQVTPVPPYSGPFYSAIHTRLVATTMSDSDGRFSLDLPEGTYSLFVRENGQYYANLMTDDFIYPVDVVSGATTTITFDITYTPHDPTGTLEGTVLFWEGDFMPGQPTGTITPVVREVLVYEATTLDQVAQEPFNYSFFTAIHTRLVATTMSDSNGHFSLDLPAATYSLFVRENGQYYANGLTGEFINPVDVVTGATTTVTFDITYMMTW